VANSTRNELDTYQVVYLLHLSLMKHTNNHTYSFI